jgi:uncharacterized membrane protein YkvA (DUF1232 family)
VWKLSPVAASSLTTHSRFFFDAIAQQVRIFCGIEALASMPSAVLRLSESCRTDRDVGLGTSFRARLKSRVFMFDRPKEWARVIKRDVHALYLAGRDPRVPWYAKALAVGVAAYALSPIDLIPDFVPILGYLDDVILVPLGILLVVRLIPPEIMAEHRELASAAHARPISHVAAVMIGCVWIASIALCGWLIYRRLTG